MATILNSAQQRHVLEVIAERMGTVNRVLMLLQTREHNDFEASILLDAAQFMAETVGAMADGANGGDMSTWLCGAVFADLHA